MLINQLKEKYDLSQYDLLMTVMITHRSDGKVVAYLNINNKNGDEVLEPFCEVYATKKAAMNALSDVMTGNNTKHYDKNSMKFFRALHETFGKDEVYEYLGNYDEKYITHKKLQKFRNKCDMLQGCINRICVSDDAKEIIRLKDAAIKYIDNMIEIRLKIMCMRKDNQND